MREHEFSADIKRSLLKRAQGRCECRRLHGIVPGFSAKGCGGEIGKGNRFFEHVWPIAVGGFGTYGNGAVLVRQCWEKKTAYDRAVIEKIGNQSLLRLDREKRRSRHPMPGSIASGWRKPMRGKPERRA